jgi:hypothetical protein
MIARILQRLIPASKAAPFAEAMMMYRFALAIFAVRTWLTRTDSASMRSEIWLLRVSSSSNASLKAANCELSALAAALVSPRLTHVSAQSMYASSAGRTYDICFARSPFSGRLAFI